MVKSADRTIQILELLAAETQGLSHAELSSWLSIPKSSLTALVGALVDLGYVENDRDRRRYLLGPRVVSLARNYLARMDIVRMAQPVLARLVERLGESCALTVRRNDEMLVVCKQDADQQLHHSMQLGDRGPIYASATGKALLVAQGEAEVARYLETVQLKAVTPYTLNTIDALRADLALIRTTCVGHSRAELVDGIHAIGVAVLDANGTPVAGLSASVPTPRDEPEHVQHVIEALFDHADALTRKLGGEVGGTPPHPAMTAARPSLIL